MRHLRRKHPFLTGLLVAAAAVIAVPATSARSAAAPANVTPPTIDGVFREARTVTAQTGTWQNNPTSFSYRWQRCDEAGEGCSNLPGETQRTYTLDANDVGHTIRLVVTAANADGSTSASSNPSPVISANTPPRNTARPTISGSPRVGEELTADRGSWTGGPDRFAHQWQRCESDGTACTDVAGATGQSYGVRSADARHRIRVVVTATNAAGSASASSDQTGLVPAAAAPARNQRPTIVLIGARRFGHRVYVRFRVCDDSRKNLTIIQTDSRPGVLSFTRRFTTLQPPLRCGVYARSWMPAPRFRGGGRYVVTLRVRDKSGLISFPARRVFIR
jgi:hypothetical protein